MEDTLGCSCGARGIDYVEDVVLLRLERSDLGAVMRHEFVQFFIKKDLSLNRKAPLFQLDKLCPINKQVNGARIGSHGVYLVWRSAGGQRCCAPTCKNRSEINKSIFKTRRSQDRDGLSSDRKSDV